MLLIFMAVTYVDVEQHNHKYQFMPYLHKSKVLTQITCTSYNMAARALADLSPSAINQLSARAAML